MTADGRTLLSPLLLGAVNVVFQLNADLPLVGLVSDEGVLQQLVGRGALRVVLHQAALNETKKLLGPVIVEEEEQQRVNGETPPLWRRCDPSCTSFDAICFNEEKNY